MRLKSHAVSDATLWMGDASVGSSELQSSQSLASVSKTLAIFKKLFAHVLHLTAPDATRGCLINTVSDFRQHRACGSDASHHLSSVKALCVSLQHLSLIHI